MIAFCYLFSGAENMFHSIFQARSIHGAKTVTCTTSVHSKFLPHLQRLNSFCVESEALWEPYTINCSWVLEDAVEWPSYDNGVAMFLGCYLRVWAFQRDYTSHSEMSPWRLSTGQWDDPKSADEGEKGPHCEQHANCTLHTEYFITYQLFVLDIFSVQNFNSSFCFQCSSGGKWNMCHLDYNFWFLHRQAFTPTLHIKQQIYITHIFIYLHNF